MYNFSRTGIIIILTGCLFPVAAESAEIDASILICRDVQPVVRRAQCYDQAIDRLRGKGVSNVPAIPSMTNQTPAVASPEHEPVVTPEAVFGKSQRETTRILTQGKADEEDLDSMDARVVAVRRDGLGKLIVELDNQQVWIQTDATDLNLRQGENIRIIRGFMNSFQLEKKSGSRRIRVKRND